MRIICSIVIIFSFFSLQAQQEIDLYDDIDLKMSNKNENITRDKEGLITYISEVSNPRLIVYKPDSVCGTSVIVCPGGGYQRLNIRNARNIAEKLNKIGVTVFILVYRLPTLSNPSVSEQDLRTALKTVSKRSTEWGLDKSKIGIWGSSAGGHLAAMVTVHSNTADHVKPCFSVLAWPVISMREGVVHKGSLLKLLRDNKDNEMLKYYSADENVGEDTPPCFIVHADNDPTVSVQNSLRFYQALRKRKIKSELHIYQENKHGFGLDPEDKNSWITQLEIWLKKNNFL